MTETHTPTRSTSASSGSGGGAAGGLDPRQALVGAMHAATPVLALAAGADLAKATPCDAFTLHDLLAHVLAVGQRAVAMGHGHPAASVAASLEPAGGDWAAHWRSSVAEAEAAWPGLDPATPIQVPWATLTAAEVAAIYTSEVVVHTWDLAVSIGTELTPDTALVEVAEAALHRQLPDADRAAMYAEARKAMPPGFVWTDPFAEAVAVGVEGTPVERLVALAGRDPAWSPTAR